VPELPEVETVRAGLARELVGRTISDVEVRHPRTVRRHVAGGEDFTQRLRGATILDVRRRGKFLWLPLRSPDGSFDECLGGHLGMSGQLLLRSADAPEERHLHARLRFADAGPELRFVDQRTFGSLQVDALVPSRDVPEDRVPSMVAHIARDPLDPAFDEPAFARRLRARSSGIKRALLDQTLVSGIGNIYADESLWRARLHGTREAAALRSATVHRLLGEVRDVLRSAIAVGGTSFDSLYVNVNGQSGYFDRTLAVYGREGRPCPRCGTPIRRMPFANRSSYFCPRCQRSPRRRRIVDPP
jgi:formamidopyrimidine-DNA glycosylase